MSNENNPATRRDHGCCVITTTVDSAEAAERIANALLERREAACVQILGPIRSIYRWEGIIESGQEWQCQIKTPRDRAEAVHQTIVELHKYEVPEIIVTPILGGNANYLEWLRVETRGEENPS
jgi:periplasmic divalent cation tolerance protein